MSGKPKVPVYEYNKDGKFLKKYESLTELRAEYFPNYTGIKGIFIGKKSEILGFEVFMTPSETIVFKRRIHRDIVKKIYRIYNSKLILDFRNNSKHNSVPIEMYNLLDQKIAEFSSLTIAKELLDSKKIPNSSIFSSLYKSLEGTGGISNDYYFKFKE